jgi:nicotinamide mononucleotide (NMN) deamidase PncC
MPSQDLISALHASDPVCVLAITGGGSGAIGQLLATPGASRTVLEAVVPYSNTALTDWLGGTAEQSCSAATARAMAMAAWMRARQLAPATDPHQLIGLGATASLASDRPKQGDHRIHVATQTATVTTVTTLVLGKDQRDRFSEEALAAQLVLLALAKTSAVDSTTAQSEFNQQLLPQESVASVTQQAELDWTALLLGDATHVCHPQPFRPQALLCGAFNPPHDGHRRMAAHAAQRLGCPVDSELSITNVDKPPLDFVEIERRLGWLDAANTGERTVLTDAPTFRAKAQLFPGCTFVVGADTIARVGDPKYYTGESGTFDAAIGQIATHGCRFLVFGREIQGEFQVLADLPLPAPLRELCEEVPGADFREDVSSTELRKSPA